MKQIFWITLCAFGAAACSAAPDQEQAATATAQPEPAEAATQTSLADPPAQQAAETVTAAEQTRRAETPAQQTAVAEQAQRAEPPTAQVEQAGTPLPPAADGPAVARRVIYVDVRRPDEHAEAHVTGAIHIPVEQLASRWSELEAHRDAQLVLYCRTGGRAGRALQLLQAQGFQHLINAGGLTDLQAAGVPVTRRY